MAEKSTFPKTFYKRWLYRGLKVFTLMYVAVQLVAFHLELAKIPVELAYFWMFSLFCYATLKEAFRWGKVPDGDSRKGELYALLIIGSFLWMEFFNITMKWGLGKEFLDLPEGYLISAIEALLLLVGSAVSAMTFHCKNNSRE